MEDPLDTIPRALLFALLDNPYESLILIDAEGIVKFVSESNQSIRSDIAGQAVGRHISEVSPDSRLLQAIETGKAEIGRSMVLKDQERIVARIPLAKDGKVVGAAGKLLVSSPQKLKELYQRIENLEKQLDYYKAEFRQAYGSRFTFDNIIGQSPKMLEAKALAQKAAQNDSPVIIFGESGTGKEMFAHAIHQAGRRSAHNFIRINCGAIPAELMEAELFGYEPGAFTGANPKGAAGKIELAHNGTLFLDEIGEMPLRMQVKMLRVLQDKVVERIGGGKPRQINFRIISATHQDLEGMLRRGTFRLDLFYRLNVMTIKLPALRAVKEDIPMIFNSILKGLAKEAQRPVIQVTPEAERLLCAYNWPGNIRELRNIAERALIVCEGSQIGSNELPSALKDGLSNSRHMVAVRPKTLRASLEEAESRAIREAMALAGQNKVKASELLGIHRTGLYQKLKKLGLKP